MKKLLFIVVVFSLLLSFSSVMAAEPVKGGTLTVCLPDEPPG